MLPISLSVSFDDFIEGTDFLALLLVEFDPLLRIQRDRIMGKQAEATPMQGSTAVHMPALTYSPETYVSFVWNGYIERYGTYM